MMFMIVGGMIFANALDESGLLNRIVLWAGTKCRGSLLKLLMALMVAGLVVMLVSFTNGWMVTIVLCYGVVKALRLENTKEGILIMIVAQIVSTAALNFIYSPVTVGLWGGGVQMVVKDFEMTCPSSSRSSSSFSSSTRSTSPQGSSRAARSTSRRNTQSSADSRAGKRRP